MPKYSQGAFTLNRMYSQKIAFFDKIVQILIFSNLGSDNLPNLYRRAELYVFTSYCEVFGFTSLEAMSQKTPVVISNKSFKSI